MSAFKVFNASVLKKTRSRSIEEQNDGKILWQIVVYSSSLHDSGISSRLFLHIEKFILQLMCHVKWMEKLCQNIVKMMDIRI